MENSILISFVLPIYNVEKYLEECFNSIAIQVDHSCEIILVDDGSTDTSGSMCDTLKAGCDRTNVNVIHKQNGGLASARNAGLNASKGKYVIFVDADDRIANELSSIIEKVKNAHFDLCFMQGIKFYPNGKVEDIGDGIKAENVNGKTKDEVFKFLSFCAKFPGSSCTKIYSKSFLDEFNLHFPDGRMSEDLFFVRDTLLCSKKLMALDNPFYQYRQGRMDSITHEKAIKRYNALKIFVQESVEKLSKNKIPNDFIAECFFSFIAYEYSIMMYLAAQTSKEEFTKIKPSLKEFKWTLKYAKSKKVKIIYLLSKILPLKAVCKIIKMIKK